MANIGEFWLTEPARCDVEDLPRVVDDPGDIDIATTLNVVGGRLGGTRTAVRVLGQSQCLQRDRSPALDPEVTLRLDGELRKTSSRMVTLLSVMMMVTPSVAISSPPALMSSSPTMKYTPGDMVTLPPLLILKPGTCREDGRGAASGRRCTGGSRRPGRRIIRREFRRQRIIDDRHANRGLRRETGARTRDVADHVDLAGPQCGVAVLVQRGIACRIDLYGTGLRVDVGSA